MQSDFARDLADDNRPIELAVAERPGKPIRLRLQPMILRQPPGKVGTYQVWKDVRWTLECDTPEEAFAARDAMRAFFATLAARGPAAVRDLLAAAGGKADAA